MDAMGEGAVLWILRLLAGAVSLWLALLWACLGASLLYFRRRAEARGPVLPMTLIKPVRGLDENLRENFESIAASESEGRLQVLIALESGEDPAYPVALDFAAAHPGRDISVVLTGPSRDRMGKIHNMIEALPRARHPYVIFSDADSRASPGLLCETGEAFARGYDAVFALPYHDPAPGLGGIMMAAAFNHCFCLPAALSLRLGLFRSCAGAWMAYSREVLQRVGGLEQFSHSIADDLAISSRVLAAGAKPYLTREFARLRETGASFREVAAHLAKWAMIVRWALPWPSLYLAMPLFNHGVLAVSLWLACEASGESLWLGRGLLLASLASRGLVAALQDILVGGIRMPWPHYLVVAFTDLGVLPFWVAGLRSTILWRGTRYRLHPGGRAEVLA